VVGVFVLFRRFVTRVVGVLTSKTEQKHQPLL
jgi:hypothetical protein